MRCEDWPEKLDKYVIEYYDIPFSFGMNDCCTFAAGAIKALMDVNVMEDIKYIDKKSAYKFLKNRGGLKNAVDEILTNFGFEEIPPLLAQRGDVVLYETPLGDTIGVCFGGVLLTPGDNGLVGNLIIDGKLAWRIK